MNNKHTDAVLSKWAGLGVSFQIDPAIGLIDLERLILDAARHASGMSRLFIMTTTWLHTYGDLIAKHRLKRLIRDELEDQYKPVLGLMLDIAQQGTHPLEFQTVIKDLKPAPEPRPLFDSASKSNAMKQLAQRKATSVSKKWNLWCQENEFKHDAMRPSSWVIERFPELRTRADFRGDLRASIIASLRYDPDSGQSESRLAQLAGGSRAQVRSALRNLELSGRVRSRPAPGSNRREIMLLDAG